MTILSLPDEDKKRPVDPNTRELVYTSPSAISVFDETQDGGCPTRWFLRYVLGEKEPKKVAQVKGTLFHKALENYFMTGERAYLDNSIPDAYHVLPRPGDHLYVEHPIEGSLLAAGVPVVGFVDWLNVRGQYIEPDTFELKDEEPGTYEVGDNKTTSNLRWAKTEDGLFKTVQMPTYAEWVRQMYPVKAVRISHVYFELPSKQHQRGRVKKVTKLLSAGQVQNRWVEIEQIVARMKLTAHANNLKDVPKNPHACEAFGGCHFKKTCFPKPSERLRMSLLSKYGVLPPDAPARTNPPKPEAPEKVELAEPVSEAVAVPPKRRGRPPKADAPATPPPAPTGAQALLADLAKAASSARLPAPAAAPLTARFRVPGADAPVPTRLAPPPVKKEDAPFCDACGEVLTAANGSKSQDGAWRHIGCPAGKPSLVGQMAKATEVKSEVLLAPPEDITAEIMASRERLKREVSDVAAVAATARLLVNGDKSETSPPSQGRLRLEEEIKSATDAVEMVTKILESTEPAVQRATKARTESKAAVADAPVALKVYVNCVPVDMAVRSLDGYVRHVIGDVCKAFGVQDVRVPDDKSKSSLGFGGWRGVLATAVAAQPPAPDTYFVTSGDELTDAVVEAVVRLCAPGNAVKAFTR